MIRKIILAIVIMPFLVFFFLLSHQQTQDMKNEISNLEDSVNELEDQIKEFR